MKRFVWIAAAAFLVSGMTMAQDVRPNDNKVNVDKRAERITERMVRDYGLNDEQQKQLLEANKEWIENRKDMPMPPRGRAAWRHHQPCDGYYDCCDGPRDYRRPRRGCCDNGEYERAYREGYRAGQMASMTDEQREQLKAEREKKLQEMKANRENYEKKLQKIMTEEQYADYQKRHRRPANR